MSRRRRGVLGVLAVLGVVALTALSIPPPESRGSVIGIVDDPGNSTFGPAHPAYTNVTYVSSVDGWPLSYLEWLPSGFTNSSPHPLVVFLHGIGTSGTWIPGGEGALTDINTPLVLNASRNGYVLISLNTRSNQGFYANSPCGGPQEQDVLDAITSELSRHSISTISILGFSMGTIGALSIAGHYPGLVTSVGLVGPITDLFQAYAYQNSSVPNEGHAPAIRALECGAYPENNASVDRLLTYLSVLRFHPQNFSGIRVYVVAGGQDDEAPNNFTRWAYANANSTVTTATCRTNATLGEPGNCTVPLVALHARSPDLYAFRFIYEAQGTHSMIMLSPSDLFRYWLGDEVGGVWTSTFPPGGFSRT